MKKILLSILITCAFISSCNAPKEDFSIDLDNVEKIMIENTDSEFGYCDVSQYYLDSYFKTIDGITKAKISVSNDSSNFNEFGIFEFKTDSDAKKSVKNIKTYLLNAKKEFENGIIYDVEEYPKFENAKAERFGNIVIYTILNEDDSQKVYSEIKKQSKKGQQPLYLLIGRHTFADAPLLLKSLQAA